MEQESRRVKAKGFIKCFFSRHCIIDTSESIVNGIMYDERNFLCKCKRCGLYVMHDGAISGLTSRFMSEREAFRIKRELESTNEAIESIVKCSMEKYTEKEETLQNLTKPNKSDLISRQAAIDTVMGFMPSLTTPDGCGQFDREIFEAQEMFVDIGQALNKLPSAQPFTTEQIQTMQELESAQVEKAYELGKADRPTGDWIETEHSTNENGFKKWIEIRCPFCGHEPVYENIDDMEFCPKCGADMRGGDTK